MGPAFIACTSELVSRWEDSMGSGKEKEIDVWPELQDLTGDVISRAAFGSSLSEGRRIFRIQSEQVQLATQMSNMYIPECANLMGRPVIEGRAAADRRIKQTREAPRME
ncbi:hypothetical protein EJB05_17718, partial [Eragrostis curvula]